MKIIYALKLNVILEKKKNALVVEEMKEKKMAVLYTI